MEEFAKQLVKGVGCGNAVPDLTRPDPIRPGAHPEPTRNPPDADPEFTRSQPGADPKSTRSRPGTHPESTEKRHGIHPEPNWSPPGVDPEGVGKEMDSVFFNDDRFELMVDTRGYRPEDLRCTISPNSVMVVAQRDEVASGTQRSLSTTRSYQLPQFVVPQQACLREQIKIESIGQGPWIFVIYCEVNTRDDH
ncbi:hypothetical protein GEV33_009079 [Tenebrio molitor]|uniref:SHSP domain-containing protein n=1 Tax=Tenebrio molitor TaxID=7067 RepID=A0A8J6LHM2_TENMO|nr:hypothetical protein GEV33_009079 [Tenebrio molitor]